MHGWLPVTRKGETLRSRSSLQSLERLSYGACMYPGHRERRREVVVRKPHGGLCDLLGSFRFSPKAVPKRVLWRSDLIRLLTPLEPDARERKWVRALWN